MIRPFYVQILIFMVGVGGDGAGQHIRGKGDAHSHVRVHVQKGDEHGADDGGGAQARKARAQTRAHAREKGD